MAALEFMLTGMEQAPGAVSAQVKAKPQGVASAPVIRPTMTNAVVTQAGEGGIFFANTQPTVSDAGGVVELGLKFYVEKTCKIKAFYFYQAKSETGIHTFHLWSTAGEPLLVVTAAEKQGPGWIEVLLKDPFPVAASTEFIVSYTCNQYYVATPDVFTEPVKRDGLMALAGLYSFTDLGRKAPDKTFNNMNYFLDVALVGIKK